MKRLHIERIENIAIKVKKEIKNFFIKITKELKKKPGQGNLPKAPGVLTQDKFKTINIEPFPLKVFENLIYDEVYTTLKTHINFMDLDYSMVRAKGMYQYGFIDTLPIIASILKLQKKIKALHS